MRNVDEHPDPLRVELLFLDLPSCTRCRGADRSLGAALDLVGPVFELTGIEVVVDQIHIESVEQARRLRFESSPTIRVNGRDIALPLHERSCGSEACTGGCGERIACRVWVHDGQEYTEPPVSMIVDAILREAYANREIGKRPKREAVCPGDHGPRHTSTRHSLSGAKARVRPGRAQLNGLLLDCCHVELDRRGAITEYHPRSGSCERCRTTT